MAGCLAKELQDWRAGWLQAGWLALSTTRVVSRKLLPPSHCFDKHRHANQIDRAAGYLCGHLPAIDPCVPSASAVNKFKDPSLISQKIKQSQASHTCLPSFVWGGVVSLQSFSSLYCCCCPRRSQRCLLSAFHIFGLKDSESTIVAVYGACRLDPLRSVQFSSTFSTQHLSTV